MAGGSPAEFRAGADWFLKNMGMIDPRQAERYAALNARSDPAATTKYLEEDMSADYRPGLKTITVPLLEVSPYYKPDFSKPPLVLTEAQKTAYCEQLLAGAPHAKVVSISPSRHFAMLAQPAKFRAIVAEFLAARPKR